VINKCDVWQVKFPKDPLTGEVLSLMGDAYGAQNKHEQAARAYERSTKEASSDEVLVYSLFEASKQMQKAGMWEPMTAMFEEFVKNNPEHQAAVAGLYWIGRAKAKLGKTEEAKTFLIEQTRKYINEPKREAVESLLTQVAQLCLKPPPPPPEPPKAKLPPVQQPVVTGAINVSAASPVAAEPAPATPPERPPWDPFAEYDRLTAPLLENAQPIAKARVLFGRGELFEMKRQPDKKQELLAQISKEFKPEDFSPILLGRVGDYRKDQGNIDGARALYEKLKEDFRKSEYLDYAYTGLGDIAFAEKQYEKAMENYDTALEKVGATFKLKEATVGKAKALLELGRFDESKKLFEQVASIKEWRGDATALAIFSLGEIEARQGRYAEAIAHFRRVFVAYQKYLPWVARSYIRAAESFDKMNKRADGIQNLQEMLRNEKLQGLPEIEQARQLLQKWQTA
jgi:tetratricopeptide (TPR) repeat protein